MIYLFADDIKLFNVSSEKDSIQTDITEIFKWSEKWQLGISYEKSCVLHIGHSNPENSYTFGDKVINDQNASVRDLGVLVSKDLKFTHHINDIVKKSSYRSFLLKKSFTSKNRENLMKAFTVYVRPILEYCSTVWNPHLNKDIQRIEKIQRKFTKSIFPRTNPLSYEGRLSYLNLSTLESRRHEHSLCIIYGMFHDLVSLNFSDFFTLNNNNTRNKGTKISVNRCNTHFRKMDFSNRYISTWNNLTENIVNSSSMITFKKNLKKSKPEYS